MTYKPNSHVMDLIMPDARAKGINPQKVIEQILLAHYNNTIESLGDTYENNGKGDEKCQRF